YRNSDGKAAPQFVPPRSRIPYWKGLGADSEEKREPASDIDTEVVDSLKVLDPDRPIREGGSQCLSVGSARVNQLLSEYALQRSETSNTSSNECRPDANARGSRDGRP